MSRELPHSESEWRAYLQAFSDDVLTYDADDLVYATAQQRAARWLGAAGAHETELSRREAELGVVFPPSYRNFLRTTNGWTHLGPFVHELLQADEVDWFPIKEPEFLRGWDGFDWPEIVTARRSLVISGAADGAYVYLDPHDVGVHGEWAAWWYAHWEAEFTRYSSFSALVEAQWASFESMWTMDGRPPRPLEVDGDVETGREAIWAADTLRGMGLLQDAAGRGSVRANVLAEVYRAFHGQWWELGALGNVLSFLDVVDDLEPEVMEAELIPIWVRAAAVRRQKLETEAGARLRGGALGERIAAETERQRAGGSPPALVENPEYAGALERARVAVARGEDSAWPLLQEALRRWQPTSRYRLAPVALLFDPQLNGLLTPERAHELLARYA
jgi:hypothetical protein